MTTNVIDISAYRRPPAASSPPAPQEIFISAYDGLDGYVFGTIDDEGRRTIHKISLPLTEACSLISDPSAAFDKSGF